MNSICYINNIIARNLGTKISPLIIFLNDQITISTASFRLILNLVIFFEVIGNVLPEGIFLKTSTTEPLLPNTLPYLTILKINFLLPVKLFAEENNLSEHNFVAPYKFMGEAACL